jgi:nitric oxide reductase large subunit
MATFRVHVSRSIRKDRDWHLRRTLQHWSIIVIALTVTAVALLGGAPEFNDFNVLINAALVSFALLVSTAFELVGLHFCQDASAFVCGGWIAASPLALGYAEVGELRYWHLSLGAALLLLATINLWKGRRILRRD